MRRPVLAVLAAVLAALVVPAAAPAQTSSATPFPGDQVDVGVSRVGDVDVARDGTGAVVYVKPDGGVDHVFASRLVGGAFTPPERLDVTLPAAAAQPVVAAADGGRLVAVFTAGGAVLAAVRPGPRRPWTAPQVLATAGSDPSVDLSINGVAYASFTGPGAGGSDVRVARLEHMGTAFTVLDAPADLDPAAAAGTGTGRSRVSVAADGSAVVGWGEGGHVIARRVFERRLSVAPQDLGAGDAVDLALEDDSSFGWAVLRQGGAVVARRLLGSTFDPPVALGGDVTSTPRLSLGARGDGYAGFGNGVNGAFAAVLKDDRFNPGIGLGGGSGVAPGPVPATAYNGNGVVAYHQGEGSGATSVRGRYYELKPASRVVTAPSREALLSRPELGPADPARGLAAGADRLGDAAVAFVQGADGKLVVAVYDRPPARLYSLSTRRWQTRRVLAWGGGNDLWGPVRGTVYVDGRPVGSALGTKRVRVTRRLRPGRHRWSVVATDRRGQRTRSATATLRVEKRRR